MHSQPKTTNHILFLTVALFLLAGVLSAYLLCPVASQAATRELGQTFLHAFDQKDTGGGAQNFGVVQDKNGLIYVANLMHVLEYDGMRWRQIYHPQRFRSLSVCVDSANTVFVGYQGDFGFLERDAVGRNQFHSLKSELPDTIANPGYIWNVTADNQHVYFRSPERLYRWTPNGSSPDQGQLRIWSFPAGSRLKGPFIAGQTCLVWQNGVGLVEVCSDSLHLFPNGNLLADIPVRCMTPLSESTWLLACEDKGLYHFGNGSLEHLTCPADDYVRKHFATSCQQLPDGRIALGTRYGGLLIITRDGQISRIIDKAMGLPDDNVLGPVFVDDQWGLWTPLNYGIARVEALSPLDEFGFDTGLEGSVNSILRFNKTIYVGTSQGLSYLAPASRDGRPASFKRIPGVQDRCWQLLSVAGNLYAILTDGIYRIVDPARPPQLVYQIDMAYCATLSPDSSRMFIGTYNQGLHVLRNRGNSWKYEGTVPGTSKQILRMTTDTENNLWLMVEYKFIERIHVDNSTPPDQWKVEVYNTSDGLPKPSLYYPILLNDQLFVGSVHGLHRFNAASNRFVPDSSLGDPFGSGDRGLWNLTMDPKGRVWFNSQFAKGAYVNIGKKKKYELKYPLVRVVGGNYLCFYPEQNGDVVWAGSEDGRLIRYDQTIPFPPETPFPALIRRVTIGGDSLLLDGSLHGDEEAMRLPYSLNSFRFEFTIPRFDAPAANKFEYRLVGLSDSWSSWTNEIYKDFNSLLEGRYRFEVRGHDVYYHESEIGGFDFIILPPWYRSYWAYSLYVLLFIGGVYLLIKWEIRRVEQRNRQLEKLVEKRTGQLAEANKKIQEYNETLEEKLEERTRHLIVSERQAVFGQLVQGIVHNLRNPLTTSMNSVEIMRIALERFKHDRFDSAEDEKMMMEAAFETVRKSIRWMEQANDTLNDMINTLLTKSRSDKGENMKHVDLNQLVENELKFLQADLRFKKLAARNLELEDDVLWVHVVPGEMTQVFQNLIRNAVDAMHGMEEQRLWIRSFRRDGKVFLEIEDNGPGISEENQERIFDPFFSTKPAEGDDNAKLGEPKGTGLGLWMCKEAMESFNGNIMVRSTLGKGALFTLSLPLTEPTEQDTEE